MATTFKSGNQGAPRGGSSATPQNSFANFNKSSPRNRTLGLGPGAFARAVKAIRGLRNEGGEGKDRLSAAARPIDSYIYSQLDPEAKLALAECGRAGSAAEARQMCSRIPQDLQSFVRRNPAQQALRDFEVKKAATRRYKKDPFCSRNDGDEPACRDQIHSATGKEVCKFDKNQKCTFGPGERKARGLQSRGKSQCRKDGVKDSVAECARYTEDGCDWDTERKGCYKKRQTRVIDDSPIVSRRGRGEGKADRYDDEDNFDSDGEYDEESPSNLRDFFQSNHKSYGSPKNWGNGSPKNSRQNWTGSPSNRRNKY